MPWVNSLSRGISLENRSSSKVYLGALPLGEVCLISSCLDNPDLYLELVLWVVLWVPFVFDLNLVYWEVRVFDLVLVISGSKHSLSELISPLCDDSALLEDALCLCFPNSGALTFSKFCSDFLAIPIALWLGLTNLFIVFGAALFRYAPGIRGKSVSSPKVRA